MSQAQVTFYYDLVCPYAYLASMEIEAVCVKHGARLHWQPILLGGLLRTISAEDPRSLMSPSKSRYNLLDIGRWAEFRGVPIRLDRPPIGKTVDAMRLLTATEDPTRRVELTHALYRACWRDGEDIADHAVLARIAGGTAAGIAELVGRADVKAGLRAATDGAAEEGLFGVPSFVVGSGEAKLLFWGQDRLQFVDAALGGWRPQCG